MITIIDRSIYAKGASLVLDNARSHNSTYKHESFIEALLSYAGIAR